jgi:hypothetical protein
MERLDYTFSQEDFDGLVTEIIAFHDMAQDVTGEDLYSKNHNSCHYCPYTKNCWGELIVK